MEGNYKKYFIEKVFYSLFLIVVGYRSIVKTQQKFIVIGRKYQSIQIFFSHMVHLILFWMNQVINIILVAENY
jgi:hypothetical protein